MSKLFIAIFILFISSCDVSVATGEYYRELKNKEYEKEIHEVCLRGVTYYLYVGRSQGSLTVATTRHGGTINCEVPND